MIPRTLQNRYAELERKCDHVGAARMLEEHPEMLAHRDWIKIIHSHARLGEIGFVRALLDAGVDVNLPESDELPDRPICSAVLFGWAEMVQMLLDRGSDVNWGWGDGPFYCVPLCTAIRYGRLDIVEMLVEAGGLLNVIDRAGHTPLSWALASGHQEIVAYLRAKGAVLPHQTPGYVPPPPPPTNPIDDAVRAAKVEVLNDPIMFKEGITVGLGLGPGEYDGYVLFTRGMSDRAMTASSRGEAYSHAELVLYLRDVHSTVPHEWPDSEYWWLVDWMLKIARWPFEHKTWLNGKWTIISNEDPLQPLSEFTEMTCWLLLGEKEPLDRVQLPDGKSVCFYTLMPIHTAERDLALRDGIVALLELFAEHDVPTQLDPQRPSVV